MDGAHESAGWRGIITKGELLVLAVAALALILLSFSSHEQKPFASAEVKFTDASAHGLSIVPASCPSAPHFVGQCGGGVVPLTPTGPNPCPAGSTLSGSLCVEACQNQDGGGAPTASGGCTCPTNFVPQGSQCVLVLCPTGQVFVGGTCVTSSGNNCSPAYFCSGNDLRYLNASCTNTTVQTCAFGCAAGACNLPSPPGVTLWQVRPLLVQRGNTVSVSWNVTNVRSCTVTGTNGDAWSGASGAQTSSPITGQTTYTLSCVGLDDSVISRTSIVNIVPVFNEQ